MIFLDASVVVAILARESDASLLVAGIAGDLDRRHSAVSQWEAVAALCKSHKFRVEDARALVDDFLSASNSRLIAIGAEEASLAADAYARYGRGRHPAALNMGDCFAYACARSAGARLLYKGNDFASTDLA